MKKINKNNIILLFLLLLLSLYMVNANLIIENIKIYNKLFIEKLFPSTFLIILFSSLLINYNIINVFNSNSKDINIKIYIIILSIISGFPNGIKYIKDIYNKNYIAEKYSNILLMFNHFPNPIFILGPVNLIINNCKIYLKIIISIYLSNILIAFSCKKQTLKLNNINATPKNLYDEIINTIKQTLYTLTIIYGTSIFFYLISVLINNYLKLPYILHTIINLSFDLTNGIIKLKNINNIFIKSILIIFFLVFGNINIHVQTKSILADTTLKYKYFFKGRIISVILAEMIFIFLYCI